VSEQSEKPEWGRGKVALLLGVLFLFMIGLPLLVFYVLFHGFLRSR
jgi:hypothetical protein